LGKLNVSRASVVFFQRLPWPSPPQLDPQGSAGAVPAAVSADDPRAARVHRQHFDPTAVQISALLSIKTGGCPPQRLRRIANARS